MCSYVGIYVMYIYFKTTPCLPFLVHIGVSSEDCGCKGEKNKSSMID